MDKTHRAYVTLTANNIPGIYFGGTRFATPCNLDHSQELAGVSHAFRNNALTFPTHAGCAVLRR